MCKKRGAGAVQAVRLGRDKRQSSGYREFVDRNSPGTTNSPAHLQGTGCHRHLEYSWFALRETCSASDVCKTVASTNSSTTVSFGEATSVSTHIHTSLQSAM